MRLGGFSIFERDNTGSRLWAAYHSPHSLTWRWTAWIRKRDEMPQWFKFRHDRNNTGGDWIFCLFRLVFSFNTQRPMWYRDLYRRAKEQADMMACQQRMAERQVPLGHEFEKALFDNIESLYEH